MDAHAQLSEPLAAFVLDACDSDEAAAVEAHLEGCVACAVEASRLRSTAAWMGVDHVVSPPARLRDAVLAQAREARRPSPLRALAGAYAGQVTRLDRLLAGLDPSDWRRADPRHGDLSGMIAHLASNDAILAADLGLPAVPVPESTGRRVRDAWRAQADALVQELAAVDSQADLGRPARLVGRGQPRWGVLRDALVQRAFETWTHLDDVGEVVGRSQQIPPPEQVRRIIGLAVGLMPEALRGYGVARPDCSGRLVLAGEAGGEWSFPLGSPGARPGREEVVIGADAVEFARLVAGRRSPDTLRYATTGDRAVAVRILQVASTLGCD